MDKQVSKYRVSSISLPLAADWRVQELLWALNERILTQDTVFAKVRSIAGSQVRFYQYRDGSYYICE